MLKKILLTAALLVGSAFAQGGAFGGVPIIYPNGSYVPYANIYVCNTPAAGLPCSNKATLFTDATLGVGILNPIVLTPQNFGQFSFGAAMGNYVVQVTGVGLNSYSFPVTFGIPSGSTIVALTITNLTVTSTLSMGTLTISPTSNHFRIAAPGDSDIDLIANSGGNESELLIKAVTSNTRNGEVQFESHSTFAYDPIAAFEFVSQGNTIVKFNVNAPANSLSVNADGSVNPLVVLFANLPAATSSHMVYCSDCTNNSAGHVAGAACVNGGNGALAIVENASWRCF